MSTSAAAIGAAYDARAEEYAALLGSTGRLPAADAALIERWREATPGPLVDAGCGPGQWTALLARGGREVVGVDASAAFVRLARSRYPGLRVVAGTLDALPVPRNSQGGILAWYSLIHTPPEEVPALLRHWATSLAPGGSVLIGYFEGPSVEGFDHAVTRAYFWPREQLAAALEAAGFDVVAHHERQEPGQRRHGDLLAVVRGPSAGGAGPDPRGVPR